MDENPFRTSTSMKQRHFMDEEPIDDCLATPGCHREASRRECRAEPGREPDHNPGNGTDSLPFGTRPCPRSASVEGPRANVPIEALFAT